MPRKPDPNFVRAQFELAGYELLGEYVSAKQRMSFRCDVGHEHSMTWDSFRSGKRCHVCTGQLVTHEQVEKTFDDRGYTLLDQYKNSSTHLRYKCPSGHQSSMTYANFSKGHSCPHCCKYNNPFDLQACKSIFASAGYTMLETPTSWSESIRVQCPDGHNWNVAPRSFRDGRRCKTCRGQVVTHEQVESFLNAIGYQLHDRYVNSGTHMRMTCDKGHSILSNWENIQQGSRCAVCAGKVVTFADVQKLFAEAGYTLLATEYKGRHVKLPYVCPEGHTGESMTYANFLKGHRCPVCSGHHRTEEERIASIIKNRVRARMKKFIQRTRDFDSGWGSRSHARQVAKLVVEKFGREIDLGMHLDHLIPCSFFDLSLDEEIAACWHPDNLRWLTAKENQSRGNRLTLTEAESFTPTQLDILRTASRKPIFWQQWLEGRDVG